MMNNIYIFTGWTGIYRVEACDSEEVTEMQRRSKTHRRMHGEQQA